MSIIHSFKDLIFSFKMTPRAWFYIVPIFLAKLGMIMCSDLGNC